MKTNLSNICKENSTAALSHYLNKKYIAFNTRQIQKKNIYILINRVTRIYIKNYRCESKIMRIENSNRRNLRFFNVDIQLNSMSVYFVICFAR